MSPPEAYARITDWQAHVAAVPFTRIRLIEDGFVARTQIGPIGFDDPMVVVSEEPPRFVRLEKRGRVVTGWAEIRIDPVAGGSRVRWREVAHVAGVPRLFAPVERRAGRLLFSRVIDTLLRS